MQKDREKSITIETSAKRIPFKKKHSMSWQLRCRLCLLPSLLGICVFFVVPYIRILYYSLLNNQFQRKFVGFTNYMHTISNEYFQLAFKNSILLIIIGVPVLVLLSLIISLIFTFVMKRFLRLKDAFIFPMLVPTAAIVLVWQLLFSKTTSALPVYLLFIWKNIGICIILLSAALTTIDHSIYEAAKMDGAKGIRLHLGVTIPILSPTILFTVLLAIVNSFKIFKESYLYYGSSYPPDHSYTLQYYMNNHFMKFDYQALAAGSILTSIFVLMIVLIGLKLQRRYQS